VKKFDSNSRVGKPTIMPTFPTVNIMLHDRYTSLVSKFSSSSSTLKVNIMAQAQTSNDNISETQADSYRQNCRHIFQKKLTCQTSSKSTANYSGMSTSATSEHK
jgi:phosphoenolpyruvate carboxylase